MRIGSFVFSFRILFGSWLGDYRSFPALVDAQKYTSVGCEVKAGTKTPNEQRLATVVRKANFDDDASVF